MQKDLIITADGSHSIQSSSLSADEQIGENKSSFITYHSKHGALQESLHVFIKSGLHELLPLQQPITVFEMGFGTGLNALLTALEAERSKIQISYNAVEAFPLEEEFWRQLNFCEVLSQNAEYKNLLAAVNNSERVSTEDLNREGDHTEDSDSPPEHPNTQPEYSTSESDFSEKTNCKNILTTLHSSRWNDTIQVTPYFDLIKFHSTIQDITLPEAINLVYFDAFAPDAQPELWTAEMFARIAKAMAPNGILVTYCSKGYVRRNLQSAGLEVEKIPGPPGKREMLRARKPVRS